MNKDTLKTKPAESMIGKDVLVRADSGVLVGELKSLSEDGKLATLSNARQIWYFVTRGLNCLDIATVGILKGSKVTHSVEELLVTDCRQITPLLEEARKSIDEEPPYEP